MSHKEFDALGDRVERVRTLAEVEQTRDRNTLQFVQAVVDSSDGAIAPFNQGRPNVTDAQKILAEDPKLHAKFLAEHPEWDT